MKDVPTCCMMGLEIACLLSAKDPRDALISTVGSSIATLPTGAVVGTASLRRQAQIKRHWPDLCDRPLARQCRHASRENRTRRAATLLALAGLKRLGRRMPPARSGASRKCCRRSPGRHQVKSAATIGQPAICWRHATIAKRKSSLRRNAPVLPNSGFLSHPIAAFAELQGNEAPPAHFTDRAARRKPGPSRRSPGRCRGSCGAGVAPQGIIESAGGAALPGLSFTHARAYHATTGRCTAAGGCPDGQRDRCTIEPLLQIVPIQATAINLDGVQACCSPAPMASAPLPASRTGATSGSCHRRRLGRGGTRRRIRTCQSARAATSPPPAL